MKITLQVQTAASRDKFDYAGPVITIGRDPDATLSLDGVGVSWQHARIDLAPKKAAISDLNSTNGTYLNGQLVQGSAAIKVGDTLRLGQEGPRMLVMALELAAGPTVAQTAPAHATRAEGLAGGLGAGLLEVPTRGDDEIPVAPPPAARGKNGKAGPAPAPVSQTRKLLIKAIQQQQTVQTKQKRSQWVSTLTLAALVAALTVLGYYALTRLKDDVGGLARRMDDLGQRITDQKEELGKQQEQHLAIINAKLDNKFMDVVAKMAKQEEAQLQAQNKLTDVTKQLFNLEELNKRVKERPPVADLPPVAPPPLPPKGQGRSAAKPADEGKGQLPAVDAAKIDLPPDVPAPPPAEVKAPAPAEAAQIEFKKGDPIDVMHKNGHVYTGGLVFVSAERIKLCSNPNWPERTSDYDMREVLAIQTKDGMYAFNKDTGAFVNALSSYALNEGSEAFVKQSGNPDTYLAENVKIIGTRTVNGLMSLGQQGQNVITLPLPMGPDSIPAYQFQTLVTSKGVFEWNKDAKKYDFKKHETIAAEIRASNDKYWKEFQEERYRKNMEGYEAATRRLKALAPYWGYRWWWY